MRMTECGGGMLSRQTGQKGNGKMKLKWKINTVQSLLLLFDVVVGAAPAAPATPPAKLLGTRRQTSRAQSMVQMMGYKIRALSSLFLYSYFLSTQFFFRLLARTTTIGKFTEQRTCACVRERRVERISTFSTKHISFRWGKNERQSISYCHMFSSLMSISSKENANGSRPFHLHRLWLAWIGHCWPNNATQTPLSTRFLPFLKCDVLLEPMLCQNLQQIVGT